MSGIDIVRASCPAKVNLFLEVLARRDDGYHEIVTVLQAVDLSDTVEIRAAKTGIALEVEGAYLPAGPGNLVYDAAALFLPRFAPDRGVRIVLSKRIPERAGLGGGSSDAAGTLLGLRKLFRPDLPEADLAGLAQGLGSDVPFFLRGGTALARGRGEEVSALPPLPPRWLVLFLPPFGLSTPDVYRQVLVPGPAERKGVEPLLAELSRGRLGRGLFNRLEEAATRADPRIGEVRQEIARRLTKDEPLLLSGSGSAFFAPVADVGRASDLAAALNRAGKLRALAVRTRSA